MRSVIMKSVIILLSIFLFLSVTGMANAGKTDKKIAYYTIYFDNNGEIIKAELTKEGEKKCSLKQGDEEVTDDYREKVHKKFKKVEQIGPGALKYHGQSGCIIYMGGWPICVCCPPF